MGGVIDPRLVAGSSLYWAAVVFSFAFDGVSISPAAEPASAVLAYGLVALMLLCFIPMRQVFERRRSRQTVALAMALVVLLFFALSRYPLGTFMPITLVTGVVLLYLPHACEGLRALVSSAAGLAWLAWATMSAVQLSDFKETCEFREFTLCAIEKSVLSLSIVAGSLLSPLVHWSALEGLGEQVAQAMIIGALCALVLLSTFVMSLLLDYRQQDELARRFEMENRELSSALYREIAKEFKLSDRELQIMALLAEGYSRTYIRDSLGVSEGTIKAHVSHIYQKIGIHRKDDLLDLVESRRS